MANEQIIQEIKERVINGERNFGDLQTDLETKGYSTDEAKEILAGVNREIKKDIFNEEKNKAKNDEYAKGALFVVFMLAIIPAVFDAQSPMVYIITAIIGGIAGYIGFRKSPIAGAVSAALAVYFFKYAYQFYFAGRESFIKIELVVPMLIAAAPAFIVYFILAAVLPKK
jgi:hypothetical protein